MSIVFCEHWKWICSDDYVISLKKVTSLSPRSKDEATKEIFDYAMKNKNKGDPLGLKFYKIVHSDLFKQYIEDNPHCIF